VERYIFCGSRTLTHNVCMQYIISGLRVDRHISPTNITIVHGDAAGADKMAGRFAHDNQFRVEPHHADWDKYGTKAAGPIRNIEMLDAGADAVYAFVDKPLAESRGTAHMVKIARGAKIPVFVIETLV
jgi:hypothetical protein